jgi:acyl-CoA thioester hydrolase
VISTTHVRVRYGETDQMQVVYHAAYLTYFEIGRTEFIRNLGLPYAEMERRGVLLAVADASLRYHAAAKYDDLLRVETRLTKVGSRGVGFAYVISHDESGKRLVSGHTDLVSLDASGRPTPMPASIRTLLEGAAGVDA